MPEDVPQSPTLSSDEVKAPETIRTEKKKFSRKKIFVFLGAVLLLTLLLVAYWYFMLRTSSNSKSGSSQTTTKSAQVAKKKVERMVWVKDKEVWVKEEGKEPEKIFSETRRILSWDVATQGNLVYVAGTEKNKDEIYGTELISLDLSNLKKTTLFAKSLEQIDKEMPQKEPCWSDDADISYPKFSVDGKYLAFASLGLKIMDVKTKKIVNEIGSSSFKSGDGNLNCLSYGNIRWFSKNVIEIMVGRWESADIYLVDLSDKSILATHTTGYEYVRRLTLEPKTLILNSLGSAFDVASDSARTKIGEAKSKYSVELKNTIYQSKENSIDLEVVDNNKVYFFERESSTDNKNHKITLKSLDIATNSVATLKVLSDKKNSDSAPYPTCSLVKGDKIYYQLQENSVTTLSNFDFTSKQIGTVATITRNNKDDYYSGVNGCFAFTAF